MDRGFQLKLGNDDLGYDNYQKMLIEGKKRYDQQRKYVEDSLINFIDPLSGKIDGSKLQADWFPNIEADIFISHSHRDKDLAIALSEYLYQNFDLNVFIDSCIWGYSDEHLKIIDDKYCLNSDQTTYNYSKRNYSTRRLILKKAITEYKMKTDTEMYSEGTEFKKGLDVQY